MKLRILLLFLTTSVIFIFIVLNIIVFLDFRHIDKTYYRFNHKESVLSVLSNAGNNSGQNYSNDVLIKSLLNFESMKLSNNESMKSDPEKQKLLYADYVKYITFYRINKLNFCGQNFGSNLTSLIFVFSRVDAFKQRDAIRKTWAKNMNLENSKTKILFVLGSSESYSLNNDVIEEDEKYNDLIQWQFIDSYYNCTLKAIGLLRWTLFYCKNVKFIMKTDDDILVNSLMFNQFIANITNSKKTIYGTIGSGYEPHRNNASKWFISYESYSPSTYPDFMFGSYIMSSDSIYPIYTEILNSLPALAFEDVYISGIIAEKLNITRINTDYFVRLEWLGLVAKNLNYKLFKSNILFSHDFSYSHMISVWNRFHLS
jgi:beta-1,3-N-acetylglucosaminyltransferase 7